MTADSAGTTAPSRHLGKPWLVLAIVLTATFMQLVDISIVNVAIPSIQRDLNTTYSDVQFVLIGYQLAFASLLITAARLGDLYDRRRMFLGGMALFAAASALCGAATSPTMLIWARVLQGLGGALMFSQVLAIIQVTFPPRERGKAFSVFGATIGIATITGPLIGGVLLAWNPFDLQWRSIFYVNLPIAAFALVLGFLFLPSSRNPSAVGLDLGGVSLSALGLSAVIYPLTVGREKGWPAWVFGLMAVGLALLAAFVWYEARLTRRGGSPLVPMSLFADRAFRPGLALSLVFFAGLAPFFFALSLYLQVGFGFSPLHSGLTTFPFAVGSGLASAASERLARRLGRGILLLGSAILVVSMLTLSLAVHVIGTDLNSWKLWPILFVGGLGLGCFVAPFLTFVLAGVSARNAGPASGVVSTGQQVGGAAGIAVIGIVLFGLVGVNAEWGAGQATPQFRQALATAGVPAAGEEAAVAGFTRCFVDRAHETDPSTVPASCRAGQQAAQAAPAGPAVSAAAAGASSQALKSTYARSFSQTLWYQAGLFALSMLLVLTMPKVTPYVRRGAEDRPGAPETASVAP